MKKLKKDKNGTYIQSIIQYVQLGGPTTIQMLRRLELEQNQRFFLGSQSSELERELLKARHSSHIKTLIHWYREELKSKNTDNKFTQLL